MAAAPRPERKSELQPTGIAALQTTARPGPITVAGMDHLPVLEAPRPAADKPSTGASWPLEDKEISDALEPMFAVPSEAPNATTGEAPAVAVPSDASSVPSATATDPPLTTEDTEPMFPDPSEAPTETLTSLVPPPVSETSTTLDVSNVLPHAERGTGAEARVSVVPATTSAGGLPPAAASNPDASRIKRSQASTLIVQRPVAPSPPQGVPSSAHDASGWSHPPGPASGGLLRGRAMRGGIAAAVALSLAAGVALFLRQGGPDPAAAPAPAAAARASKPAMPEPAEPGPSPAPPSRPTVTQDAADAGMPLAAADAPKTTPAQPATGRVLPDGEFDSVALKDERLVQLFAFEQRTKQPSCAERLGPSARRLAANNAKKSQAALKAARKALVRGDNTKAHVLLCTAVAHQAANVAAWQALAELMLNLGDPAQAKQAAEQALKSKPQDRDLLGIIGDAWAMLGDLQQSRTFWARCLPVKGGAPAQRDARLAALFGSAGDRLLRSGSNSAALVFYRRAVVLSAGARAPSTGMAEALRRLHQAQAVQAWTERVARAFPTPEGGKAPPAGG